MTSDEALRYAEEQLVGAVDAHASSRASEDRMVCREQASQWAVVVLALSGWRVSES